jgi:hypothetical protein
MNIKKKKYPFNSINISGKMTSNDRVNVPISIRHYLIFSKLIIDVFSTL